MPNAVVHIDLDGAPHIFQSHGWNYTATDDPLFRTGLKNALSFLARNEIKATLFVIGDDTRDPEKRELLQEAVSQGHEIASHSLTHRNLAEVDTEEKRREVAESKSVLETTLGTQVYGFRAPSYSIDRECIDLLDEHEYLYDSSVFPTAHFVNRVGAVAPLGGPARLFYGRSIVELPLPAYRPAPFPFHPCYSLILGDHYFKWGLRRFRKSELPLVFLFHLTDFSEPLPAERLPSLRSKIFTLSHLSVARKIQRCQAMLDLVRARYAVVPTVRVVQEQIQPRDREEPVVLAISTTHETGAAVFEGTDLKAAISEERLDRVKFSTRFPPYRSIEEVIRVSRVDPRRIQDVVVAGLPARPLLSRMIRGQLRDVAEFHGWIDYFPHLCKLPYRAFCFYRALHYGSVLSFMKRKYGVRPRLHFVEHHRCHASATYRTAPFDDALIVTADGVGDDLSLTISTGRQGRINRHKEIAYPHSFGQFYTACTQVLGFRAGRHEGKITGLSGYGKVDPELYKKVKSTIRRSGPNFALDKRFYSEGIVRKFSLRKLLAGENLFDVFDYRNYKTPLKKLVKGYPRENVAATYQKLLEDEMAAVVRPYAEQSGLKNLALCGGVFANVKLNASLFRDLGMERVFVFPHMGDGGLCVGAALEFLQTRPTPFDSVYWGPDFSEEELEEALLDAVGEGLSFERKENIEKEVAGFLAEGRVIARFNGRMEFGPRALGNRSILYSATDPTANDWLNKRLRRTEFMPFAPVVMAERAADLFTDVNGKEHSCKFMTIIVNCNDWTKEHCPAIVHVDGTARPQFVTPEINESMYRILWYYDSLVKIPLLVNTSFNMHEEPIVCTPRDAVRAYLASRLDYLAMGPFLASLGKI